MQRVRQRLSRPVWALMIFLRAIGYDPDAEKPKPST